MEGTIITQIRERFRLEMESLLSAQQINNLVEDIRMEKYQLRQRENARVEYEGSLKSLLDKLTGKKEQRIEELDRAISHAKENLDSRQRQLDLEKRIQMELQTQIASIPNRRTLREQAAGNPEAELEYARQTAVYCTVVLEPLLKESLTALEEIRQMLRGNRAGEIMSYEQRHTIYTKPDKIAEEIRPLLLELQGAVKVLGLEFSMVAYFKSPSGYLAAAAAHNQLNRVNLAIDEVTEATRSVRKITEALS